MNNILVPTDFSEVSEYAADYAAELVKIAGGKLIFLHIYTVPVPVAEIPVVAFSTEELEEESMKLLDSFDKRIKERHGNIETELRTRAGFVVDEIVEISKTEEIELIVMGVTGAGKVPGVVGSNATSVMHHAKSPVVIVPHGYKFKKPEVVALACDYKSTVPEEAVEKFKSLVRMFNSKVLVFNVLKTHELATYEKAATEVNLENMLDDIEHTLHFPAGDNIPEEMNTFVAKNNADILAMFPHNYSFFKGMMHHSHTKHMAFVTHVPLISIHE